MREQKAGKDSRQRDYANFGLSQQWQVNDKLSLDASINQVKNLSYLHMLPEDNTVKSGTVDSGDYAAISVGAGWNDDSWSATGRLEYSSGEVSSKRLLSLAAVRELSADHALATNLRITDTSQVNNTEVRQSVLGLHMAARPAAAASWFNRLDLKEEQQRSAAGDTTTRKVINNLHYLRAVGEDLEFSVHHGFKLGFIQEESTRYRSLLDTMQAAVRLDITEDWDAGVQGGYLHNWDSATWNYFSGVSVGFSPSTNTRVELGYNLDGFEDEDFDSGHYTRQGPYIDLNYKLDQGLIEELKAWSER